MGVQGAKGTAYGCHRAARPGGDQGRGCRQGGSKAAGSVMACRLRSKLAWSVLPPAVRGQLVQR